MFCQSCKKKVKIVKRETDKFGKVINYLSCGHKLFQVHIKDTVKPYIMLGIKKRSRERFSKKHKFYYEILEGERIGKDGKPVFILQIIDRVKNYYKKFVKQGDKIIKNIEEKLTEHK
ncbi:MAG TPA: hypothetical protein PL164_02645 [Candidatus Paceibacterota bacterium]|nr:hypothetical protein [Candidatus Paceibacterota bacterium]